MRSDPETVEQWMNDKSYSFEKLEAEYDEDVAHAKNKFKWEN